MTSANDESEPKDVRLGRPGRMAAARLILHDYQDKKLKPPQWVVDVAETGDLRKRPEKSG